MKGNNGSGNIEKRDDWQTPQWLFDKLNEQYIFYFDCCASSENKKCMDWHDDFLKVGDEEAGFIENDMCWMNPPFSKAKQMFQHFFDVVPHGVAIYRCDNLETSIWQDIILKYATWVFIPKGRISYEGKVGKGSRFPSALIGFNVEAPKGLDGFTLFAISGEDDGKRI
jgi:hypothetical protein